MENESILERIEQSDMVLAGLGEDFGCPGALRRSAEYVDGCRRLGEAGLRWLLPAWNEFCAEKAGEDGVERALKKLAALLERKNYFVVSVSTNPVIRRIPWKRMYLSEQRRCVMPCGSVWKKQCSRGCEEVLEERTKEDAERLRHGFGRLSEGQPPGAEMAEFGVCPKCGAPLIWNNIYADNYNENGYLEQWRLYTKWLQGTLNRNLLVLELGVGMRFPSVVRWPFERIAYFNQKAYFCRVNERLYQLSAELTGKGCGISQNAIDWLGKL